MLTALLAFIIRGIPAQIAGDENAFKVIQVRIDELLNGKFDAAASLEPGDIVNVPRDSWMLRPYG